MTLVFVPRFFAVRSLGVFFFNDTATTEIYTLSLHDALPISAPPRAAAGRPRRRRRQAPAGARPAHARGPRRAGARARHGRRGRAGSAAWRAGPSRRSEEHTSELQSQFHLVCRLLLEKKKK